METKHTVLLQSAADIQSLGPETVDLVVTSPPYPMIEMWDESFAAQDETIADALKAADGRDAFELMHRMLDSVWQECHRLCKPGAMVCINIGDATRSLGGSFRLYTNQARITQFCESIGFQSLPAILWRKQTNAPNKFMGSGMLPAGAYVTLEHEYILIFRKGGKRIFSPAEKERRRRSAFFWEERNQWFSDVWDFKGIGQTLGEIETRQRSGAFPFELAFRLINMYSMQEDTCLDPFVGTGTTVSAAMAAGRNSFGLEIEHAFMELIGTTLKNGIDLGKERQLQRLETHHRFVRQYQREKNRELQYYNNFHQTPVMTRQETEIKLPVIRSFHTPAEIKSQTDYRVVHTWADLTVPDYLPLWKE